jgi:hypothetical protein
LITMQDHAVAPPRALREALAHATTRGRLVTWAYLTVQGDRVRSERWLEDRREKLRTSLWAEGCPEADIMAIDSRIADAEPSTGRLNRYVLAEDGRVVLDELLPGPRHGSDRQGHGFVADVIPVLRHVSVLADEGHPAAPFAAAGVQATVSALRGGRAAAIVLDPDGFGEQTLVCLDGAPWVDLSGVDGLDPARVVALAPTATALVRAALQTGVDVAFAPAALLPENAPVAFTAR